MLKKIWDKYNSLSLVKQIIIGIVLGILAAYMAPEQLGFLRYLGTLFVKALKSVAPVLVLLLVTDAICRHKSESGTNLKTVVIMYLIGTMLAALLSVMSFRIFQPKMVLHVAEGDYNPPSNLGDVFFNFVDSTVSNVVSAVGDANYVGILAWAILLGWFLRNARESTKDAISDLSAAVSTLVTAVIKLCPLGVLGLVFDSVVTAGAEGLKNYGLIIVNEVSVLAFLAFVVYPLMAWVVMRQNPYPLVFTCLRESGLTAFFTRSSAANIPVNMSLCKKLGLDPQTYAISIPLGSTMNTCGAAVTINVLTLAAVNTLGIHVDVGTGIMLSLVSAACSCGTSGIAGGSLLLIPVACSMFGIDNDVAMQVVGAGFIMGVINDSCETALNSSTDVLFTAAADIASKAKKKF